MTTVDWDEAMPLFRMQKPALAVGIVGLVLAVVGALTNPDQFYRSWLIAFVFIESLSVGSLAILMIQYLTGGVWGVVLRRPLESATRLIPFVALTFLPILFGMHRLYEWSRPEVLAHDAMLQEKSKYLNITFFTIRTGVYFALWMLAAYLLNRWSTKQERAQDPSLWRGLRMRHTSAFGLVVLALTLTFASVDWLMSLTPHWYSTMFGISFMIGNALTAFAFVTIVVTSLSSFEPIRSFAGPKVYRDLGNLMFAFTMLWTYTTFSEFLLIWYANIREEVPWHLRRSEGGWGVISLGIIVFHFFLPFFLLLMRTVKDRPRSLGYVAAVVVVMRYIYYFWIVEPTFNPAFRFHWLDAAALLGLGGVWFFLFLGQLKRGTILPTDEPHVQETLTHG
jgi:hypothetical protein